MFVGVSGLIGAGKSTLTAALAKELDRRHWDGKNAEAGHPSSHFGEPVNALVPAWKAVFEPVEENPYLEDFYLNIERWTFNMQMFLLAKRFEQHQEVLWDPAHRAGGGVIQDRTIYEDTIFARMHHEDGLMVGRDWETYIAHFNIMKGFLRYPDVILYLRVSPQKALERINQRARAEEVGKVPLSYLEDLFRGYEDFVEEMKRYSVVLQLDWEDPLPVTEVADRLEEILVEDDSRKFLRSLRRI